MTGAGLAVAVPRAGIPHLRRHGGIRRKSLRKARKLLGLRYNVKRKWFPPVIGNAGGALPNAASLIAQENPLVWIDGLVYLLNVFWLFWMSRIWLRTRVADSLCRRAAHPIKILTDKDKLSANTQ